MNILLAAIGKMKSGPEQTLWEQYGKRTAWKIAIKEFEINKTLTSVQRKEQEAELLLTACKDADHIIALDEHGKSLSSPEFAVHLQKQQDNGMRKLAFIIGGADGLHESVLKHAQLTLSFGRLTWPHMLVRGLLAEQIYRAHTIMNNHPYHRE